MGSAPKTWRVRKSGERRRDQPGYATAAWWRSGNNLYADGIVIAEWLPSAIMPARENGA